MNSEAILGAHPEQLVKALDKLFEGDEWVSWEPEVLLRELKDELSEQAQDKVLAVQAVACNGALACGKAPAFENVVHAFCNNMPVVDTLQPPYVEEIMYAVPQIEGIIRYIHGDVVIVFGSEIPNYVAAAAYYRGWVVLPDRLSFAQEILDSLTGCGEGTSRYDEFNTTLKAIRELVKAVGATPITTDEAIFNIMSGETEKALMVRLIVGAYLYDPTTPYKGK